MKTTKKSFELQGKLGITVRSNKFDATLIHIEYNGIVVHTFSNQLQWWNNRQDVYFNDVLNAILEHFHDEILHLEQGL